MMGGGAGSKQMDVLRVVTSGSVDDGKSTLIGRLLYDVEALTEDQLHEIRADGATIPDFALALDGLAAEREQGITIDVAYRSFSTARRRFLVADVPGHEQYTRNMVTGASTADLALLVMDAKNGIVAQTRRHTYLVWLLGIRSLILAVNKMDAVEFGPSTFSRITAAYEAFLSTLGGAIAWQAIPVSARFGDNVVQRSRHTQWFRGPTLAEALDRARVEGERESRPFRMPVQWVNRSVEGGRGYAGLIVSGQAEVGQQVKIQPSGEDARIAEILSLHGGANSAVAGESVTLVMDRELDIGRGHLLCGEPASSCADVLVATIIWMSDTPLVRGRSYRIKIGTKAVAGQIVRIESKIDLDNMAQIRAETLTINEIGTCTIGLDEAVAFDPYEENRDTGSFILIDRVSNDTLAAGLIRSGELKVDDIPWQAIEVSKTSRAMLKNHPPAVLWFTGIPGAGKSTIANLVEKMLHTRGCHTYLLDGDNLRHGLTRDLGFSDADRVENVRRVAEVARLMADAGLIVLVALISPFRAERRRAREKIGEDDFIEIFVDTPVELAETRDIKGHYKRARLGKLSGFTGVDSPYEAPEQPELHIETINKSAEEAAETIMAYFERRQLHRAHQG
jgi:bifunctional enzyme CysN/CysC